MTDERQTTDEGLTVIGPEIHDPDSPLVARILSRSEYHDTEPTTAVVIWMATGRRSVVDVDMTTARVLETDTTS